ncbi:hypothetical protein CYMTET_8430 [Cymbomonas tetramitiformis]|uniref:Uncharacterized protein n=1 Tax=Cymbomonas tetramitiformis TaxID=36881 RepID=A0AAE0LG32_9CHLO|nr:hypothetical protein CYMTET_8430 [Cymbomonas tetramitiformis]
MALPPRNISAVKERPPGVRQESSLPHMHVDGAGANELTSSISQQSLQAHHSAPALLASRSYGSLPTVLPNASGENPLGTPGRGHTYQARNNPRLYPLGCTPRMRPLLPPNPVSQHLAHKVNQRANHQPGHHERFSWATRPAEGSHVFLHGSASSNVDHSTIRPSSATERHVALPEVGEAAHTARSRREGPAAGGEESLQSLLSCSEGSDAMRTVVDYLDMDHLMKEHPGHPILRLDAKPARVMASQWWRKA